MKALICSCCGASRWREEGNYRICIYCGTKYEMCSSLQRMEDYSVHDPAARSVTDTGISLKEDVDMLLEKCIKDPANAFKYANLILDLDPINSKAINIVYGGKRR